MAKHYSGKRAAGRKPVGKRALSLLMALVMSLSLVQITAFAEDVTTTPTPENQVMEGWFTADGEKANTGVTDGEGFTLSKTIQQTGENAFDITLTVETTQTVTSSDAAVQLVIDTSGSMNYCSVCGKESHGKKDTCKGSPSRLDATKAAVAGEGGFLNQLLAGNTTGGAIWVSVIRFSGSNTESAKTVCEWKNIRTTEGLQAVKDAVNALRAGGGTNLEAGLMLARNNLSLVTPAKDIDASNKYTVLLTDGEPTARCNNDHPSEVDAIWDYNDGGGRDGGTTCSKEELADAANMAAQVRERSNLYTICYGVADDVLSTETKDVCENCGQSQREHEKVWVVDGYDWFWGYYGHNEYYCDADHSKTYQKSTTVTTVGSFLENSIASKPEFAFSDAGNVNKAFTDIATSTTTGMNGAGTFVTDPMGQFIKLPGAEKARLSNLNGVSVDDDNTIKWNLNPEAAVTTEGEGGATTYKYTLTYSITLDTEAYGFESNTNYPTNGRTFLTIPAEEGDASEVDFNIPGVFGQKAEHAYCVNYYFEQNYGQGDYKLSENQTLRTTAPYGEVYIPHAADYEGYTFNRGHSNADPDSWNLFYQDGQEFNLYYDLKEEKTEEVAFTVNYYFQKTAGEDDYELRETLTGSEELGKEIYILEPKDDTTGYTFNSEKSNAFPEAFVVLDEADKVFNLYYDLEEAESNEVSFRVEYWFQKTAGEDDYELRETLTGSEELGKEIYILEPKDDTTGYTFNSEKSNAYPESFSVLSEENQVFKLYYDLEKPEYITVAVKYFEKDTSNELRDPQSLRFELQGGVANYDVTALKFANLTKDGKTYNFDSASAELIGTTRVNFIINLYYTKQSSEPIIDPPVTTYDYYTVTVNYYDKDSGEVIHTAYTTTQREYTAYDVTAQDKVAITGYTYVETTGDALTGTLNGNKVINVYYTKDSNIDDGNTPTDPGTDIGDDDVPVTPAQPPKTGDSMGLWIAAAMVSGMGLIWLSLSGKKRKEEI